MKPHGAQKGRRNRAAKFRRGAKAADWRRIRENAALVQREFSFPGLPSDFPRDLTRSGGVTMFAGGA
ncbi:hypothetical protein [uncultured Mailhella sp.]|uniref:hypothetical protein n=1 Tax=uncultured Mailhella sp. TaxID=1981031 RepID=UPI002613FC0E|nr:hypothetical protein [uncultured Mailhella sp.]